LGTLKAFQATIRASSVEKDTTKNKHKEIINSYSDSKDLINKFMKTQI